MGVKLKRLSERFAVFGDQRVRTRASVELQFVFTELQRFIDEFSEGEIADQTGLRLGEPILSTRTRHRRVAESYDLHSGRGRNRNIRSGHIRRVIVEREPAGSIHQVTLIVADIRQPFRQQRAAARRVQNAAVFEPQLYRYAFRQWFAQVDANARPQIGHADLVLDKRDRSGLDRRTSLPELCLFPRAF